MYTSEPFIESWKILKMPDMFNYFETNCNFSSFIWNHNNIKKKIERKIRHKKSCISYNDNNFVYAKFDNFFVCNTTGYYENTYQI